MKVAWTIRTGTSLHYISSEYSDTRDILDSTKDQLNNWKKDGYVIFDKCRIVPWNAISELHYLELKEE